MPNNSLPDVVDLFCGCGGLSSGFRKCGFDIVYGMDINTEAVQTASYNIHWRYGEESFYQTADITESSPETCKPLIGQNGCIVIGGPPCQAYSLAGRAKLASLGEHRINTRDKRGFLYQDFLRYALDLNARVIVMENVPESTNYGGKNIPETVCQILEENGYDAVWTFLSAADFGVPQKRERIFVLAYKHGECNRICLPRPTNRSGMKDSNYWGRVRSFTSFPHFRSPLEPDETLPLWNTVQDAISDLPVLFPDKDSKYVLSRIVQRDPYQSEPKNDFQVLMRNWYGSENKRVTGNIFRKTLRDFPIFDRMKQGDNYTQASQIADELLAETCREMGISEEKEPERFEKLKKKIVPPYDRNNFLYKWQRLECDKPSHTLVAHLSVDTYSHIHPTEPRGISVREAARLQSFPDGFLFQTNMGDAYKQIGNAVPPLVSLAIARSIIESLSSTAEKE